LYLSVFCCTGLYAGVRSFQQINVQHSRYALIVPTSIVMGALDVFLIVKAATNGAAHPMLFLAYGIGGGIGSCIAVFLNHRFFAKGKP